MKKWLALFVTLALVGLTTQVARAHAADMYFQSLAVRLSPDQVSVAWTIAPGPLLAGAVWSETDQDQDHVISADEIDAWAEARVPELVATLDGSTPLAWQLISVDWPTSFDAFSVGDESICLHLAADWALDLSAGGVHHLDLHNQYQEPFSTNWFVLSGSDGVGFERPAQQNGQLAFDLAAVGEEFETYWDSGAPSVAGDVEVVPQASRPRRTVEILTRLVRAPRLSPLFYLGAIVTAILLGALHALTPGHGKAIAAAYLVGSHGTLKQAVGLGSIVTLAHTGSVLVLGVVALTASQYVLPTTLFPVLEVASGLLIVGLGGVLLYQRWRYWRAYRRRKSAAARAPIYERDATTGRTRIVVNQPVIEPGPPHEHKFMPRPGDRVTWRSLLAMGISGGLVPCPDAIAILLISVMVNRVWLGLSLIVAFSVGLAVVLIGISIVAVKSQQLLVRQRTLRRLEPVMPLVSAVLVLGLGVGLTWGAAQRAVGQFVPGAQVSAAAQFQISQARILYLGGDAAGRTQIFVAPLAGGEPLSLTHEALDVGWYSLAPDGTTIAYTVARQERGTDIWLVGVDGSGRRLALSCQDVSCDRAVWSPDGQRLIYERLNFATKNGVAMPSLWWLSPETGETGPFFQDAQLPGSDLRWSASGRWISYISIGSAGPALQIYDSSAGRSQVLADRVSQPAIWNPRSDVALLIGNKLDGDEYRSCLLRFDPATGELADFSAPAAARDRTAAWSPEGTRIAVVRNLDSDVQIWVMRADGNDARPLTSIPNFFPGTPVWSPDGEAMLFERYAPEERGIWLLNVGSGEMRRVVESGRWPTWLP